MDYEIEIGWKLFLVLCLFVLAIMASTGMKNKDGPRWPPREDL